MSSFSFAKYICIITPDEDLIYFTFERPLTLPVLAVLRVVIALSLFADFLPFLVSITASCISVTQNSSSSNVHKNIILISQRALNL